MIDELRSGLGAQLGIATENEVALGVMVTPDTFIEFDTEGVVRDTTEVSVQGKAGTLLRRSGRVRQVFRGARGPLNNVPVLTVGLARLLRHCFGGYAFSWPGSTNAEGVLTLAAIPANNDTMTIGSQVYTFKTNLTASTTANEIKIAASIALQCSYIAAAINRGVASDGKGSGEAFGSLTRLNPDVTAVASTSTVTMTDKQGRGAGANSVATTETFTNAGNVFAAATLEDGVNGTDTARLHTFTLDLAKLQELAFTAQIVRPPSESSRKAWTYLGAKVFAWELAAPGDGALTITPQIHARQENTAAAIAAASYPEADFFDFNETTLTIDGVESAIQGLTLSAELGLATERHQMGTSVPRNQIIVGRPGFTGQIEREFENMDLYDDWIDGVEGALEMTSERGLIPGSASTYRTQLTMPCVRYTSAQPNVSDDGILTNPIGYEVMDNGTDEAITLTYRTDEGYAGDNG